jgi:putative DNA primase/helicase
MAASCSTQVRRHVFMPDEGAAETCALWVLHAHAHDAAQISPLLAISAPTTSCGKTTLLKALATLTPSPLFVSDLTGAGLYRNPAARNRTLLMDEGHTLLAGNTKLQEMLNSSHNRGGSGVLRADGIFDIWSPKAIALIGELPAGLRDRALRINPQRRRASENVAILDAGAQASLQELLRRSAQWSAQNFDQLAASNPAMPESVINRAADNWRAFLAIADTAGGRWPGLGRGLASEAAVLAEVTDTSAIALLRDIREAFVEREQTDRMASVDLVLVVCHSCNGASERLLPERLHRGVRALPIIPQTTLPRRPVLFSV